MVTIEKTKEETLQQIIERLWETFPPVWEGIRRNLRAIATDQFNISVEQFHILRHIRKGQKSVSELAEIKQISRPAISQAVEVLVEKGLITRKQSKGDRRYVELELTDQGKDLLNAIFDENRKWMMEKMAALSPEEAASITRGLDILKRTLA
jgi:DNA-binding MarR family transcriptional regulator